MRIPNRLQQLLADGLITDVVRPLMSGKEAQVYLVASGEGLGVAKIYKEASERSFKHRSAYTEGRGSRNSRDARAVKKGSRYGRSVDEAAWRSAEADIIYRLRDAGVRVPEPYAFVDGVLLMELVTDHEGHPAPRLAETELDPEIAPLFFEVLLRYVVRMLCAGVVHGDLSEFNVLVETEGPVIIDFPQAVDPAKNPHAKKLLLRDVDNIVAFIARYDPRMRNRRYGQEIWDLYERAVLTPDTPLTGKWKSKAPEANADAVIRELRDVERERERALAGARRGAGRAAGPKAQTRDAEQRSPPRGRRGSTAGASGRRRRR